jgi:AcrR family transcriptional regulator
MPRRTAIETHRRPRGHAPLSRGRILETAVEVADREGIDALSMRKLGVELEVDPMSLYNHVRDKDDLLDGMADLVVARIEPAASVGNDWKASLRATILSARQTMLRHPWTARILESRDAPGPAAMGYMDTVLGVLTRGGFSIDLAHHGLHVLGSRVFGFNQDLFDDSGDARPDAGTAAAQASSMAESYPNLAELALAVSHEGGLGGCDDDVEFAFGLDLIIDGLERLRAQDGPRVRPG